MRWWGWVLLGAVIAFAGSALYTADATRHWRTELGAAQAHSAAADSALGRSQLERERLRWEVAAASLAKRISDSIGQAAQARAAASNRREQAAKDQLVLVLTATDSLPLLVASLGEADATITDQARQLTLLAQDTTTMGSSIAKLRRTDSLAQVSIARLTVDRDSWRAKAERKPIPEIPGRWFLGLPKLSLHLIAGASICPMKAVCVSVGYGY